MLDVGNEDTTYERLIPRGAFADVRRNDRSQHRYFLGDELGGIPLGALGAGPQLTPPRAYVLKDSDRLGAIDARGFAALQSFARGGLAEAWGALAFPFMDREVVRCGLPPDELREHYEIVARRIGVSGRAHDDLESLRCPLPALQPALDLDHNATRILGRYERRKDAFNRSGIFLGQSLLAALSRPLDGREPNSYEDMDFWANHGRSVYRPDVTLRELRRHPNFQYRRPFLVGSFKEIDGGGVRVASVPTAAGAPEAIAGRALILAAGSLGTTRVVLRSMDMYDHMVPFTCNPHTYIPCVHYCGLGRAHQDRCHSLAQLTMIYDPMGESGELVQAQLYSYRSLLLFRLLKEAPLPYREALRIFRTLAPSFVIWLVQHADEPGPGKYCVLRRGHTLADDRLEIGYRASMDDIRRNERGEKVVMRHVRRLGCLPIKRVHPVHGSSVHYGSQFPMTPEAKPLTTDLTGLLRGTKAVYLADGSTFAYLPAKGLTFTLMANANRVAGHVLRRLRT